MNELTTIAGLAIFVILVFGILYLNGNGYLNFKRKPKKSGHLNTRILKKISSKAKLTEKEGRYQVLRKVDKNWEISLTTTSITKAINRKHNIYIIALRDTGYRNHLLERRKVRRISNLQKRRAEKQS